MALMTITNTSATTVYVASSLRVGQITFRSSATTCLVNRAGVVRSRLPARPDRRSALWPRVWVAMSLTYAALNGSPRAGQPNRGIQPTGTGRAGGTRTPNRRFWRPGLYQLSYCPPDCNHQSVRRTHPFRRTVPVAPHGTKPVAGRAPEGDTMGFMPTTRISARVSAISESATLAV